jgi:hypothetical protein
MDAVGYLGVVGNAPLAAETPPVYRPESAKLLARVRTTVIYTHVLSRGGLPW